MVKNEWDNEAHKERCNGYLIERAEKVKELLVKGKSVFTKNQSAEIERRLFDLHVTLDDLVGD